MPEYEQEVVSPRQAAQILGVSTYMVRNKIADGTIPAFKVGTKIWRIRRKTLEQMMEGNVNNGQDRASG